MGNFQFFNLILRLFFFHFSVYSENNFRRNVHPRYFIVVAFMFLVLERGPVRYQKIQMWEANFSGFDLNLSALTA